jgi:cytoskeletal protein CcmA (bactofilin family)
MRRTISTPRKPRSRLRELLRSESGIAMPTVLTVSVIALGLGSVAAVAAITAQRGSVRDFDTKQGIAAADAGLERALFRQNMVPVTASQPCLVISGSALVRQALVAGESWCPPISGTVGNATYTYQVKPAITGNDVTSVEIVSSGTSDDITRRIEATANKTGGQVFGDFSVIGKDGIDLDSNARIDGNAGTNESVTMASNSTICGDIQYGPGGGVVDNSSRYPNACPGYGQTTGTLELPNVNQGDVAVNNDNGRFFTQDVRTNPVTWNAATRTLTMDSNSSLTLGGSYYSFCRLVMRSNSQLIVAAGAQVRVYFDSPENCGQGSGTVQMDMDSNSRITATGGNPTAAAFLFVGSDTQTTYARFDSNTTVGGTCNHEFVVYAPRTHVTMNSNSVFCGAIAGKSVDLDSNARILADARTSSFVLPGADYHEVTRYVECTGPAGNPPDVNC